MLTSLLPFKSCSLRPTVVLRLYVYLCVTTTSTGRWRCCVVVQCVLEFLLLSVPGEWWFVPFCLSTCFPCLFSFLLFLHQLREPNRIPQLKDTVLVATETLLLPSASNLVQRLLEGLLAHYFSKHRQAQCKNDYIIMLSQEATWMYIVNNICVVFC